jgi:serine/threonine protein kinase
MRAYRDKSSPEVDGRSDVYSLGIVLFEALTGQAPFQADNPMATGLARLDAPVPRISNIEPGLTQAAQEIIERALAKFPADRYQTASELGQAVKELATGRWILRKLLE